MSSSETLDFVASVTVGRVSRAVLSRVETRSFNTVKLNSHPESLRQFGDVFSDETIRDLVKAIRFDVVLPVISDKRLRNKSGRRLHPDAICVMAKALPCLEHTIWDLYMPPRRMPTLRKEFKAALASALLKPMYASLATLTILLWNPDPRNEEAILIPDEEEDRLSLGMRRICELPTLVSLFLWGKWCLSYCAFRCFGPSVRSVFVDMSMVTPDGGWLLDVYPGSEEEVEYDVESEFSSDSDDQGDTLPDINSENSDIEDRLTRRAEATANQDRPCKEIREVPNPETFTLLVTSFAQAVANSDSPSCLGFAEMRLSTPLASMRLSYCDGAGGEDPRLGALPDFAQRIMRVDKVDMNRWLFNGYGGITASGWKIPAVMWDAMEKAVGAENIDTNIDVDRIAKV
ncbi:uncharacterized protein NECHADRAFT_80886 [Fusarium vanettenii 77-13-4]|uniref:Uncharacterized protein n=1 Tax=Fusarium vanettenii (strain ATCC MYA-4622 / CBS 123669 / FGSC 9596 / NRRL 45880 / 77-13-4) TaxID=660122 RepID=C7YSY2_FUSV7|nr:uncharacterized protein NECHADRAFT_80886 [Fusarium vanettenii 77-13-4]EEU45315.1 hypothetical protein NECHADRAFT_80886 [Fusarium vanettenii 77-13-4]